MQGGATFQRGGPGLAVLRLGLLLRWVAAATDPMDLAAALVREAPIGICDSGAGGQGGAGGFGVSDGN